MANQEHLGILAKGVEAWNAWVSAGNNAYRSSRTNLAGMNLHHIRLVSALLDGANLEATELGGADSTTRFILNHGPQNLGRKFRMGALMHEMTHLRNADIYDNAVFMFAIPKTATDRKFIPCRYLFAKNA